MIFPEGHITYSGEIENLLWGSIFSRSKKHFKEEGILFRREVTVIFSKPIPMQTKLDDFAKVLYQLQQQYKTMTKENR